MRIAMLLSAALLATSVQAQNAPAPAKPPPPPPSCAAPEFRQFDFWIGEWDVYGTPTQDKIVGHNRIERVSSGCALAEHWINSTGQDGHSLNVYDAGSRTWTQFWIGSDGVVLRLSGGMQGDAMEMRGELPNSTGGSQQQRIRWTPRHDGSVEQRWETSDDEGKTWQVSFVGIYRRKPAD